MNEKDACTDLFRSIKGSSSDFMLVDDLVESETYKDLAHTTSRKFYFSSL